MNTLPSYYNIYLYSHTAKYIGTEKNNKIIITKLDYLLHTDRRNNKTRLHCIYYIQTGGITKLDYLLYTDRRNNKTRLFTIYR